MLSHLELLSEPCIGDKLGKHSLLTLSLLACAATNTLPPPHILCICKEGPVIVAHRRWRWKRIARQTLGLCDAPREEREQASVCRVALKHDQVAVHRIPRGLVGKEREEGSASQSGQRLRSWGILRKRLRNTTREPRGVFFPDRRCALDV